ncbi:unnamed protein product [Heligmosomoides polygyrus]|uniref:BMERB domain-containing protein n=1 Tax=Heligmosomoides polygyrus TaxID=6339 RepID=A0A183FVL3_HELPZ|nr:unnamed protein product [Heligmosomoides polygyrus]
MEGHLTEVRPKVERLMEERRMLEHRMLERQMGELLMVERPMLEHRMLERRMLGRQMGELLMVEVVEDEYGGDDDDHACDAAKSGFWFHSHFYSN